MVRFLHWRSLFRREKFEREMADEFTFHVQARTEDLIRSGLSPEEAERRARLEFGGKEHYRAECRESHGLHWFDDVRRDVVYASRNLRRNPGFATLAIVSLGIGLAAIGIMFSVAYTVLLRPLPFTHSDRIVTVSERVPILGAGPTVCTAAEFQRWQQSGLFESAALIDAAEFTLENGGRPERIYGASVTSDFFRVFGLQPILGRGFLPDDAVEGRSNVIVLSHGLWVRDFGGDRSVIGRTVQLSGSPMTVIGVMPPRFNFPRLADVSQIMDWAPERADFWTPFVITPKVIEQGNFDYYIVGRLRPNVTSSRAASQLSSIAVHLFRSQEAKYPQYKKLIEQMLSSLVVYVTPLQDAMAWGIRGTLWMLLAAVALLLLLVLFNLGNLLLTRNAQRVREYTVRQALGASRWQIFRQSFFEQAGLIGAASLIGTLLMLWGIVVLRSVAMNRIPRLYELHFSLTELAILLGLAFVTAIVFGTLSQLLLSGTALPSGLNSQGRTATGDRRTNRFKFGLIAAEMAVSTVLLVGAGLLIESFHQVMQEPLGFDPQNVLTIEVPFSPKHADKPEKYLQHVRELIGRLDSLPGVLSASAVNHFPLTSDMDVRSVQVLGRAFGRSPETVSAEYRVIDAAYFRTMQIPLKAGREFRADDPNNFVVINETMEHRLWPGQDAVGQRFTSDTAPLIVIGVVGDVRHGSLESPKRMQYYQLINANPYPDRFVVRTAYNAESFVPLVQKAIWSVDPSEPVTHVQTMEHLLNAATLQRRFETWLLASFAGAALFLSALGLFGVASLSTARRTREFGIRLALGATGSQIVLLELRRMIALLAVGIGFGLLGSMAVARAMSGLLYRVTPWSGEVFAAAAVVLIASALLAGWLPARRAARIDPATALRIE